jgi:hypothetical protein
MREGAHPSVRMDPFWCAMVFLSSRPGVEQEAAALSDTPLPGEAIPQ